MINHLDTYKWWVFLCVAKRNNAWHVAKSGYGSNGTEHAYECVIFVCVHIIIIYVYIHIYISTHIYTLYVNIGMHVRKLSCANTLNLDLATTSMK